MAIFAKYLGVSEPEELSNNGLTLLIKDNVKAFMRKERFEQFCTVYVFAIITVHTGNITLSTNDKAEADQLTEKLHEEKRKYNRKAAPHLYKQ